MATSTDTNTTDFKSETGLAPYEIARNERLQLISGPRYPISYSTNSPKEALCIDFVENFRQQFVQSFPSRAPLLLSPTNELGTGKFISTFIRPTQLSYLDMYDYKQCATYIANYVKYEALGDEGEALPNQVMSPATTLAFQIGNCVEMSILLCSLLIANGYSAYCVIGYATKDVAEDDQSQKLWPGALPDEINSDDESEEVVDKQTKFSEFLKKRPVLESTFKEGQHDTNSNRDYANGLDDLDPSAQEQQQPKRSFHAWVMLLPQKRKIDRPIFIEPSTGIAIDAAEDTRYLGVEAVFHHHNYYVNMHPELPPSKLDFSLQDLNHWEYVFLTDPDMIDDDLDQASGAGTGNLGGTHNQQQLLLDPDQTADIGESGDQVLDLPASWVAPLTMSRAQFENRYPGRTKTVVYENATVTMWAEYSDSEFRVLEVRLPDELTVHQDQVHTFYEHRHDLLRRKSCFPSLDGGKEDRKIHEWFLPGRKKESKVEGLRELIDEPGVTRTMRFYWKAREDGLMKRVEKFFPDKSSTNFPQKIIEDYRGREEDRLLYRSATYDQARSDQAGGGQKSNQTPSQQEQARVPIKMAEKYARNPKKIANASEDIMKLTFKYPNVTDGEIWVKYHYSADCITQPYRVFPKSGEKEKDPTGGGAAAFEPKVVRMPFEPYPKEAALRDQLRKLMAHEKDCLEQIRGKIEECSDVLDQRAKDKDGLKGELSDFDTLRNRPKETDRDLELRKEEQDLKERKAKDPLAPYIANLDQAKTCRGDYSKIELSAENARVVRDRCLADLQDRLIQRGHIMQARMDREKEELNRRQISYQKNLDATENTKDSEAFAKFCADATWRMRILDERLTAHIQNASDKYAKMAAELAADPRLKNIYNQN